MPFSMTVYLPQSLVAGGSAYSAPSTQADAASSRERGREPIQGCRHYIGNIYRLYFVFGTW